MGSRGQMFKEINKLSTRKPDGKQKYNSPSHKLLWEWLASFPGQTFSAIRIPITMTQKKAWNLNICELCLLWMQQLGGWECVLICHCLLPICFFNFLIWPIGLDFLVVSYLSTVLGLHTATLQKQTVIDHERLQLEPPTFKSNAGISVDFHFTRGTRNPLKGQFRYQKSSVCRKVLLLNSSQSDKTLSNSLSHKLIVREFLAPEVLALIFQVLFQNWDWHLSSDQGPILQKVNETK